MRLSRGAASSRSTALRIIAEQNVLDKVDPNRAIDRARRAPDLASQLALLATREVDPRL